MKNSHSRAFTLIELLVVIAIIGILTGIIITNLAQSRLKARDAKRVSDMGQIQLALELYYDRCKQYPSILNTSQNNGCPSGSGISLASYISQIPTPPSTATYNYAIKSDNTDYVLYTILEGYNEAMKDSAPIPSWSSVTCDKTSRYCLGPN
jgi:general secretion pathway protein G